jgi:TPR repeat protein
LRGHKRGAIDAAMRAIGHSTLGVMLAATTATAAFAQQNPGLSAQPSGRTLAGPEATPMEKPVDLLRPTLVQSTNERSSMDDLLYAPEFQDKPWAQSLLGSKYVRSSESGDQVRKGLELLNAAAERGEPTAQYELGTLYAEGRGVPRDLNAALSWARKAARQGYAPAKYALALALLESRKEGENNAEALSWLEGAAKDGHREAQFFLAGAIAHGDYGLPKDERKAAEMAHPIAEAGDPEFQFALATLYLKGESFADRRADGQKWLEKAAASGHAGAQQMLQEQKSPAQ